MSVSLLKARLLAAQARISSEIDELFRKERDEESLLERERLHHRALGLGRALAILRDFLG